MSSTKKIGPEKSVKEFRAQLFSSLNWARDVYVVRSRSCHFGWRLNVRLRLLRYVF